MSAMEPFTAAVLAALEDPAVAEQVAGRLAPYLVPPPQDAWMSTDDAAEYLGLSKHALHRLTAANRIPKHQDGPGCRCWFLKSELDAWRRGEAVHPNTRLMAA